MERTDIVVVGGGLAGLVAAAYAARAGARVVVLERASHLGGRAQTRESKGFSLNVGAHALYLGGRAAEVLAELRVPFAGGEPKASTARVIANDGALVPLPSGAVSLMRSPLLTWGARLEAARVLASLEGSARDGETLAEWRARMVAHDDAWALLRLFLRLTGYADDPEEQSARAALAQLRLATKAGVAYLDGGWGTLVLGLRRAAAEADVRTGAEVHALVPTADGFRVELERDAIAARAVVLATPPSVASALTGERFEVRDVEAACLDVGLSSLPRPDQPLVLGLQRPIYCSVHSAVAALAPKGGALVQLLKYHRKDAPPSVEDLAELEALLDRAQPGWRDLVVVKSFLPRMAVTHALVTPRGRPPVAVRPNLFLAGDWVGDEGMLADAAMASARSAAKGALGTMGKRHGAAA
jgi:phytoene dehydrogenase-like protein